MRTEEIIEFREKVLDIPFSLMSDKEFISEISKLYIALGDFFSMIRLPSNTTLNVDEKKRYSELKEKRREKISKQLNK